MAHHNTRSSAHLTPLSSSNGHGRGRSPSPRLNLEALQPPGRGTEGLPQLEVDSRVSDAQTLDSSGPNPPIEPGPEASVEEWRAYSVRLADHLRAETRRADKYS